MDREQGRFCQDTKALLSSVIKQNLAYKLTVHIYDKMAILFCSVSIAPFPGIAYSLRPRLLKSSTIFSHFLPLPSQQCPQ